MNNEWFETETKAYEKDIPLGTIRKYQYHALNEYYGELNKNYKSKIDVLGFGSADGGELEHIAKYCKKIYIVDPTQKLKRDNINGITPQYVFPNANGKLHFQDDSFDLITCFGVLMYIENPEIIIKEFLRVLKVGGVLLIREPSTDMHVHQNVRRYRMGEYSRGLPVEFYECIFSNCKSIKYSICHCMFSPWIRIGKLIFPSPLNLRGFVIIDAILSKLFSWNWKYQRKSLFDKFSPGSLFIKVEKII